MRNVFNNNSCAGGTPPFAAFFANQFPEIVNRRVSLPLAERSLAPQRQPGPALSIRLADPSEGGAWAEVTPLTSGATGVVVSFSAGSRHINLHRVPDWPLLVCTGVLRRATTLGRWPADTTMIEVSLTRGVRISGRCTQADASLPGARVAVVTAALEVSKPFAQPLRLESVRLLREVITGSDSRFLFDGLVDRAHQL